MVSSFTYPKPKLVADRFLVEVVSSVLVNGQRPSYELNLIHCSISVTWRGPDTGKLEVSAADPGYGLCVEGNYIIVTDALSPFVWQGRIETVLQNVSQAKAEQKTCNITDLRALPYARIMQTDASYHGLAVFIPAGISSSYTGATETIVKTLLSNNAGPGADAARQVPGLSIAKDQLRGGTQIVRYTGEPLSQFITHVLAVDDYGDRVTLNPDYTMTYEVYQGFDLTATDALPGAEQQIFTVDQDNVSDITYEQGANGHINAVFVLGHEATPLLGIDVTDQGAGYGSGTTVTITGGNGSGATAVVVPPTGSVSSAPVTAGGTGYTSAPRVDFVGGGGAGAQGTAVISGGAVISITIDNGGFNYVTPPTPVFSGGGGSGAAAIAALSGGGITGIKMTDAGQGYTGVPTVEIVGGGGAGAKAVARITPAPAPRMQLWVEDQAMITRHGRMEATLDAADATTLLEMQTAGLQYLSQHLEVNLISFQARETAADLFGVNWNVGDLVTVEIPEWGVAQDLRIQKIDIDVGNSLLRTDATPRYIDFAEVPAEIPMGDVAEFLSGGGDDAELQPAELFLNVTVGKVRRAESWRSLLKRNIR